jgi:gluconolactonase
VVGSTDRVRRLLTGFEFTEGPVWDAPSGSVIFSDIPASRLYRWSPDGGLSIYRAPSSKANGNTLDREGRLLSCEHETSRVVREEPDGTLTVLADRFGGAEFDSPNDIIVDAAGRVLFTDPPFGRTEARMGLLRPRSQEVSGVYRLDPDGGIERLISDMTEPNGLCLSLDETLLYVNDTATGWIRCHDLTGAGRSVAEWARPEGTGPGKADGLKLDAAGNVYCTGPDGVHVFDQSGGPIEVIRVPEPVGNFTWAGEDRRTLFLCASTSVYLAEVQIPGADRP